MIFTGRDETSLEATAEEIRNLGREAIPLVGDMGDPATCEAVCRKAIAEHGPIDILLNNVGGRLVNVPIEEQSLEDWQRIMDLNVTSTFLCTKLIGG